MSKQDNGPRYVAENRTVCQTGTVPDDAICWCDNHDDATRIAAALNACDGVPTEDLTPGCVREMGAFKDELCYLVDRLGHDSGGFCSWGQKSPTAEEWANEVYRVTLDNEAYIIASLQAENARLREVQADMAMLIRRIAKSRSTEAQCAAMDYLARTGQAGSLLRNNTESEADNGE